MSIWILVELCAFLVSVDQLVLPWPVIIKTIIFAVLPPTRKKLTCMLMSIIYHNEYAHTNYQCFCFLLQIEECPQCKWLLLPPVKLRCVVFCLWIIVHNTSTHILHFPFVLLSYLTEQSCCFGVVGIKFLFICDQWINALCFNCDICLSYSSSCYRWQYHGELVMLLPLPFHHIYVLMACLATNGRPLFCFHPQSRFL